MIWRSTLVFLTSLTAFALPLASLRAEGAPLLVAQSSGVDPNAAVDTGEAVPDVRGLSSDSPLQNATSEQQIEEIKTIQRELQNRGYYNGPIDGIYGPGTAAAIRTLRGQEDGQTAPSLVNPETVPADVFPEVEGQPSQQDINQIDQAESDADNTEDDSPVRINPTDVVPEDIEELTIGDEVSPETGVESDATEASPDSSGTAESSSPGLGALLWPGLALIAALGSFGIGFVLANRTRGNDDESASPWGDVPGNVPQPEPQPFSQPSSFNGSYAAANGSAVDREAEIVEPAGLKDSLPVVSAANTMSATTRLAKADVIDELVSNLQVADPTQRRKAIWELGQRGNSSAVQHLVNSMVDADSKEKSLILAALSEIGIRSLKPMNRALAIALQDDNPDVRKNAIRDLTRVYDLVTQISQMLGHATEDDDPEVRRTAEWALGQLNRIREAPKLKSSLTSLEASRAPSELLPDEVENLKN